MDDAAAAVGVAAGVAAVASLAHTNTQNSFILLVVLLLLFQNGKRVDQNFNVLGHIAHEMQHCTHTSHTCVQSGIQVAAIPLYAALHSAHSMHDALQCKKPKQRMQREKEREKKNNNIV